MSLLFCKCDKKGVFLNFYLQISNELDGLNLVYIHCAAFNVFFPLSTKRVSSIAKFSVFTMALWGSLVFPWILIYEHSKIDIHMTITPLFIIGWVCFAFGIPLSHSAAFRWSAHDDRTLAVLIKCWKPNKMHYVHHIHKTYIKWILFIFLITIYNVHQCLAHVLFNK